MKNELFGDKVKYEQFAPPFVLVALLNRFDNRYQSIEVLTDEGGKTVTLGELTPQWWI